MEPQIHNRTIFTGDNLPILRGMHTGSVDLVYLDPPFNSNRQYEAPAGSKAAGAAFKDAWTPEDVDAASLNWIETRHPILQQVIAAAGAVGARGDQWYLIYLAVRLLELRRVLKPAGSLYLHCDPTMSHGLKLMLDAIFGKRNYRNEIIWRYGLGGSSPKQFSKKHDTIHFYTRTDRYHFDKPREASTSAMLAGKPKGMIDVWDIPTLNNMAKERTGYPTQKPLALLERIIRASCPPDGMVLDPFCGCATTCVAAEKHGRRWIGIDNSARAVEVATRRLREQPGMRNANRAVIHRRDIPARNAHSLTRSKDIGNILHGKQEGICNGSRAQFPMPNGGKNPIVPKPHDGRNTGDNLQPRCVQAHQRHRHDG